LTTLAAAVEGIARRQDPSHSPHHDPSRHFDALAGRIAPFSYDPDADLTFESWYRRHEDVFDVDATILDEPTRVRLLLHKLDARSFERYSSYILPQNPRDVTFKQTVATLKDLFGPSRSLFSTRYACMKLVKDPKDDFTTYAGRVNRECAKFKLCECNDNQFKCLIFVCGLQSSDDAFIRLKLLDRIEADPNCTVQTLTEEAKRLLNLRHDTQMIEDGKSSVQIVKHKPEPIPESPLKRSSRQFDRNHRPSQRPQHNKMPPSPCWNCGNMHFVRDCKFLNHICSKCHIKGHKDGFCSSANRRTRHNSSKHYRDNPAKQRTRANAIVKVSSINSKHYRRYAAVTVDGHLINFQVDTASDITVITRKTWIRMGKPKLQPSSLIAQSASGRPNQISWTTTVPLQLQGRIRPWNVLCGPYTHQPVGS
uniref:Peptidase A2 domain-containing protein n=1 Tax=Nippostrongylus brasiliensis TaxID=27835 RepID=A0A0N4XNJ7_NIPBR